MFRFCCPANDDVAIPSEPVYADIQEALNYDNICMNNQALPAKFRVHYHNGKPFADYIASLNDDFIYLECPPQGDLRERSRIRGTFTGWKFHISIRDDDSHNIRKAWDEVIMPALIKYRCSRAKILPATEIGSATQNLQGKQITLYAFANPEFTIENWQVLFTEISQGLAERGIQPDAVAILPNSEIPERQINPYISYRYDPGGRANLTDYKADQEDIFAPLVDNIPVDVPYRANRSGL